MLGHLKVLMKKIDLHIHTVPTKSDSTFVYSFDAFKRYVTDSCLDAVAITNHNMFDCAQFKDIQKDLGITVFPGIEVNLDTGHVLIISNNTGLEEFELKTRSVEKRIVSARDSVSFEELRQIFGDFNNYLIIPHYDKNPTLTAQTLEKIQPYVTAGEVDSVKKFIRTAKDKTKLTPVLFSDIRIKEDLVLLPTRQAFIDCGEITFDAIRACLRDKSKVVLSERDGNKLWPVLGGGQTISTGLNVVLGERSSGKTYTLNRISAAVANVKYIKQFSLVQQDEVAYKKEFETDLEKRRSCFVDEYLSGFKGVLDDVMNIDLAINEKGIESYLETLLKSAAEADRQDSFSKAILFGEEPFPVGTIKTLGDLIDALRLVIENIEYRPIIEKHLTADPLKSLICELIELFRHNTLENKSKVVVNEIVKEVKRQLGFHTSAVQVGDVDLYRFSMDREKIKRFIEMVGVLREEAVISREGVSGFCVEVTRGAFAGALEIKASSGTNAAFSAAFAKYRDPYQYLRILFSNEIVPRAELYKFFAKIRFRILNKDGFEVSGGERSEFRLLQQIEDAQNYEVLLIDEPESSFDNLFLRSDVNQLLKAISELMPVVIVTHNSTVGASIGADYLLYAKKDVEGGKVVYSVYSGYPADKFLISADGRKMDNYQIMMDSLEAGSDAYDKRRHSYEGLKN